MNGGIILNKTETKIHYKLYKAGRRWLVAGITVAGIGLGVALPKASANAATATPTTEQTNSTAAIINNAATTTASSAASSAATTSTAVNNIEIPYIIPKRPKTV